jgi:hypothetical protein
MGLTTGLASGASRVGERLGPLVGVMTGQPLVLSAPGPVEVLGDLQGASPRWHTVAPGEAVASPSLVAAPPQLRLVGKTTEGY